MFGMIKRKIEKWIENIINAINKKGIAIFIKLAELSKDKKCSLKNKIKIDAIKKKTLANFMEVAELLDDKESIATIKRYYKQHYKEDLQ